MNTEPAQISSRWRAANGGDTLPITAATLKRARELQLDVEWWARRWFQAPLWAEYERQAALLRAEYERQAAPLRAEYNRQAEELLLIVSR